MTTLLTSSRTLRREVDFSKLGVRCFSSTWLGTLGCQTNCHSQPFPRLYLGTHGWTIDPKHQTDPKANVAPEAKHF